MAPASAESVLARIRAWLAGLFLLGVLGTAAELLLAEHTEDAWQWTPFALFAVSLLVLAAWGLAPSPRLLRVHQALMALFVVSGVVGGWLHYEGKAEFALERSPGLGGVALLREALKGKSPPLLAPGAMIGLGLVGLIWTYRHPVLGPEAD